MTKIELCDNCQPPNAVPASNSEYEFILAIAFAIKKGALLPYDLIQLFKGLYTVPMLESIYQGIQLPELVAHVKEVAADIPDDFALPPGKFFGEVFRDPKGEKYIQIWTDPV